MALIAVIEDETILGELIEQELKSQGYEVVSASDGEAGLALIRDYQPDLVLLDLLMPVMSGYDVLKELSHSQELCHIPVIVISNSGQADDLNRAYKLGAKDVLIKTNFNPDQVVSKVGAFLAK